MKKLAILFFIVISSKNIAAQSVEYNLMLNTLLSKTVEPINIGEANKRKSTVFLDTRAKREYEVSHIKNAVWVGYDDFSVKSLKNLKKDTEIIAYCSVGYRSEKIGEKLKKAGYKNVRNLWGGIFEWVNEGNGLVDNSEKPTNIVHSYSPEWGIWLKKGVKVYK